MDKIEELLTRGVANIIPSKEELEKVLRSGKKLRVYQGFDPTSPELHIGHMLGLKKLRQWQNLGHEVIFLIGDFTGMVGDPTGKDKTRVLLTREQVLENAKTYKEQAGKILKFEGENPVIIKYNSEWLDKLSIKEFLQLTSYLSYQQIIERDMFQKRLEKNMDIALNEFLYPFMQGYDSVAMDVDAEVGGTDQMFNMMTGRDLMHKIKRKDKFVMTIPLLTDSQGKKIGKTEGNVIGLTDNPNDLYSKIMALGDDIIIKGFEYLTDIPIAEVKEIKIKVEQGENLMKLKKRLAWEIVKDLNNKNAADHAEQNFEKVVQKKEVPTEISEFKISDDIKDHYDLIVKIGFALSRGEAKRLIEQGGIKIDGINVKEEDYIKIQNGSIVENTLNIKNGSIIQAGPRRFVRIKFS